jgi:excisionase family DNA binding protein
MEPRDILNTEEGAQLLRMSKAKLRELANDGELPAFRVGNRLRYRRCDLLLWVEEQALANVDRERTHGDDAIDYGQLP